MEIIFNLLTDLICNFYWLGIIFAFFTILMAIMVFYYTRDSYNMETKEGYQKVNPLALLFLFGSVLSWYAVAIVLIIGLVVVAVKILWWIIDSIFIDFGR